MAPPLEITEHWRDLNDHLIELVDLIPDDRLDWSPAEGQWGCRALILHIAAAREHWLNTAVEDGRFVADVERLGDSATKDDMRSALASSWARLELFLDDQSMLDAIYAPPPGDPAYVDPERFDGHFIAFHRLVHDAHHRADVIHLLTELGVELPPGRRRRPL